MCFKPEREAGHEKLERWQREREENGTTRLNQPAENTHPRGNQDTDSRDMEISVERFEALLGR